MIANITLQQWHTVCIPIHQHKASKHLDCMPVEPSVHGCGSAQSHNVHLHPEIWETSSLQRSLETLLIMPVSTANICLHYFANSRLTEFMKMWNRKIACCTGYSVPRLWTPDRAAVNGSNLNQMKQWKPMVISKLSSKIKFKKSYKGQRDHI